MKLKVEKLDHQGRGIAFYNNKIVFIPNTLPNEIVDITLVKETKKFYLGEVNSFIEASKKRVTFKCPYFNDCGGCQLFMLSYSDTLEYKKNKIKEIFKKYADLEIDLKIKFDNELHYRNKIELKADNYKVGYYKSDTNKIVEIKECIVTNEIITSVIPKLKLKKGNITLRVNDKKEVLVIFDDCLELNIDDLKNIQNVCGIIVDKKLVFGQDYLNYEVNGMKYIVSYDAFFQINNAINSKIGNYLKTFDLKKDVLVDLYCGVGSLSMDLDTLKTIGIEINENAILNAKNSAILNHKNNINYYQGDASLISSIEEINTLIVDPPRSGLSMNVLKMILEKKIKKMIYISCDPMTLARDIKKLKEKYEINNITLYDMFPYTHHIECVVLLGLKQN